MSSVQDDRPTFGTYWRKNKEESTAQSLVFVQSDPSQPNNRASEKTEESEQSAKNKRRAQIRKAQIQHRARKADYTKQLEADIAAIREQIENAERDSRTLSTENQAIRAQLSGPQQQAAADYGQPTGNPSFFMAPTSYPQDATMSYGLDIHNASLDYFDMVEKGLTDMLSASGSGYYEYGSPTWASSSTESSGIYGSLPYMDNGSNTPYPNFPELSSEYQLGQVIHNMPSFQ